jgi:hypothetical protein
MRTLRIASHIGVCEYEQPFRVNLHGNTVLSVFNISICPRTGHLIAKLKYSR